MKTVSEVFEWCMGVAERYGDPSAKVAPIYARFVAERPQATTDEILATWDHAAGKLLLGIDPDDWFDLPITADGPELDIATGNLKAFGISEVCRGLWTLTPSLNMPGLFHFFVHIYDVPESAPWERRIIVASHFAGGRL